MILGIGYGFRGFQYATAEYALLKENEPELGYLNTKCGIFMHNINAFKKQTQSKVFIRKIAAFITVRSIGSNKYKTDKHAIININFKEKIQKRWTRYHSIPSQSSFNWELENWFIYGEWYPRSRKFTINLEKGEIYVGNCEITIPLSIKNRAIQVNHTIYIKKITIISPHIALHVIIHKFSAIFSDRGFVFEPSKMNFSFYVHTVNAGTKTILICNDENIFLRIPRNFWLGHFTEMDYFKVFLFKRHFFYKRCKLHWCPIRKQKKNIPK